MYEKEKKEEKFQKGCQDLLKELEKYCIFGDSGYVTRDMVDTMLKTLDTSDWFELIEALVNICIQSMQSASRPDYQMILKNFRTMDDELARLKMENKRLSEQLKISEDIIQKGMREGRMKRSPVKYGKKIAYKREIRAEVILKLLKNGMSVARIADHLGVSRNLIYRRIEELEKAGIDVEAIRKKK